MTPLCGPYTFELLFLLLYTVVPRIDIFNLNVLENNGTISVQVGRSEGLNRTIVMDVATVDRTALG